MKTKKHRRHDKNILSNAHALQYETVKGETNKIE